MALLKNWQGSRAFMRLLLIQLVCWLAWLSSFAVAQFEISEGVTGSVYLPVLEITCVANLAAFVTSLMSGRLDSEIGAQDVLHILSGPKLHNINGMNGKGLTTKEDLTAADVVMLTNGTPNSSIREFMKSNAKYAHSIVLEFLPFSAAERCERDHPCNCIVFCTVEDITSMLTRRMPGTLKLLPDQRCLLPCLTCLRNGCHGCDESLLRTVKSEVVSEILDKISARCIRKEKSISICVPMHGARDDIWTSLLVRSFRSKDAASRGVRVTASEALEGYLAGGRGGQEGTVEYSIFSFIAPRLTEVVIILVLTLCFRVDGFSSSLVARRAVRDFLVDTSGRGLTATAFLTEAMVQSGNNNTHVCQMLSFRGNLVGIRNFSFLVGCINLISSLSWAVLIAIEDGAEDSPPVSIHILVVIIVAIGTALGMDAASLYFSSPGDMCYPIRVIITVAIIALSPISMPIMWAWTGPRVCPHYVEIMFGITVALETVCIVYGCTVLKILGIRGSARWIYGALQMLVWMKWACGCSILLNEEIWVNFFGKIPQECVNPTYCSAFLLNAVLAAVRCKWAWPWKASH